MRVDVSNPTPVEVDGRWVDSRFFRVRLDGVDVSDRCFFADDAAGVVGLYQRNETGQFFVLPGRDEVATEYVRGTVVLVPPTPGPAEAKRTKAPSLAASRKAR
jgi:hypothetical protein